MDRKEEILTLADELVKSVGYESFSYADLSSKLGITKASIHHHFPHKEDLALALCENYERFFRVKTERILNSSGSAWSKIEKWLDAGAALVEDQGKTCPVASLKSQMNVLPGTIRERVKKLDLLELQFFAKLLEQGRASGELTFRGEPAAQAALMLSALKGAQLFARVHGCGFFKDAMAQLKTMVGA